MLEVLLERRHDTISNLSFEFNASISTIKRDIQILSLSHPLYTTQGKGGGVHIVDGYRLGHKKLSSDEYALLKKLETKLNENEKTLMQSILKKFSKT
jgi:predicted DNA-binding transcriptional regulator YafY